MKLAALTALTMLAFAANSLLNRAALSDGVMDATNFATIRVLSGAVVLAAIVLLKGGQVIPKRVPKWEVLSLFAYMFGFSYAYLRLDAGLGALVLFGTVQLTMFLGAVLGGESLPARRWQGAALSLGGLAYLFWPTGGTAPPLGAAFSMVVAGVGWGIFSLRGRGAREPMTLMTHAFIGTAVLSLALMFFYPPELAALSAQGVFLALLSGGVTSGLGYALWYALMPQLGGSRAAVAQLTVPIIAIIASALLLGEVVTLSLWLAAALVLGGVAVSLSAK